MNRVYTGIKDCNGKPIYSDDKVKYTYLRCGKVGFENICSVEWGYDDVEQKEGWIIGGSLLDTIGKYDTKKSKEIIEVIINQK